MQSHVTQKLTSEVTSLVVKVFSRSGSKVLSTDKLSCGPHPRTHGAVETTPRPVHVKLPECLCLWT